MTLPGRAPLGETEGAFRGQRGQGGTGLAEGSCPVYSRGLMDRRRVTGCSHGLYEAGCNMEEAAAGRKRKLDMLPGGDATGTSPKTGQGNQGPALGKTDEEEFWSFQQRKVFRSAEGQSRSSSA